MEGEGAGQRARFIGQGEAAALEAKGLAEGKAKEAVAKGMNILAEAGKDYRTIDYLQAVQSEFAKAMQGAEIKFISTQPPGRFLELFTAQGGASMGGALSALAQTGGTEELVKLVRALRGTLPGVYEQVKKAIVEEEKALKPAPTEGSPETTGSGQTGDETEKDEGS